ncbi:MAG: (Fe-S)-binding protein [Bacillaceae bacterium]|nr:(Fe-S)-binding protein [Bacillaceae bacterium]
MSPSRNNPGQTERARKLFELTYEETNQCIQCGYCLPACPTYQSMGRESASPRGRIALVKMAAEGKLDITRDLAEPIDLCLGCRACETACPVGVPYGHILEETKQVLHESVARDPLNPQQPQHKGRERLKKAVLRHLFPYPKRLRIVGRMVYLYQKSGADRLATGVLPKISEPAARFAAALPRLESPSRRYNPGDVLPPVGPKKARVAFFNGCLMDAVMYRINRLTIELLRAVGCEVVIPETQTCCGALHAHQGMKEAAEQLARANIGAFERSESDFYINNAGGCGAMLIEYDQLLGKDPAWRERARDFVSKSRDISQVLDQFGPLPFKKEWNGTITYQDSCHLRHVQKVTEEPRRLLQSVPGATFVEMADSDRCCGSGGIYNLLHYDESMKILDDKMEKAADTCAETIVTTNPGCLLQMKLGVARKGMSQTRVLHLVEVLAEACGLT